MLFSLGQQSPVFFTQGCGFFPLLGHPATLRVQRGLCGFQPGHGLGQLAGFVGQGRLGRQTHVFRQTQPPSHG